MKNCYQTGSCPKSGIKIHENRNGIQSADIVPSQEEFYNRIKSQNKHTGVRVNEEAQNHYSVDPFEGANPFNITKPILSSSLANKQFSADDLYKLDLNLDNYSMEDIYNLFGLKRGTILTVDVIKEAKKVVLKTHPDKSKLDAKYFLFFGKAFKKLHSAFEFQNKSSQTQETFIKRSIPPDEKFKEPQDYNLIRGNKEDLKLNRAMQHFFEENQNLDPTKQGKDFNHWFNEAFEKCRVATEEEEKGYGEWLKSDEGIQNFENVTKANMTEEMENYKKKVQSLVQYSGKVSAINSSFGTELLGTTNHGFGSTSEYTDLRLAYEQSVIPITMDDYANMSKDKYKSLDAYRSHRDESLRNYQVPSKTQSMHMLYKEKEEDESQSAALAFYHAKQLEQTKEKIKGFWSNLLNLEN